VAVSDKLEDAPHRLDLAADHGLTIFTYAAER
jgi:hypothetical protein